MDTFTVRALSFSYPGASQRALDGVELTLRKGDLMVLCGPSGCGKTTLLRQLKSVLAPHGEKTGQILFEGRPLDELSQREQAERIGFVGQSPENQLVTDKVWHELAFGLESLGLPTPVIRRRVAEMASFFGIQGWFRRDVAQLSGGQKQLLVLASVMALQPSVLILDEPTSQLDPIAASDFLSTLGRLNRELGVTVLLSEHRLEEALPLAASVTVMDSGKTLCEGEPSRVCEALAELGHPMLSAMPTPARVWGGIGLPPPCPVTVREGRTLLARLAGQRSLSPLPPPEPRPAGPNVLRVKDAWFRYEKDGPDVLRGLELTVGRGEFFALLGGNGTGKSTTLRLLAGFAHPYRGQVERVGRAALLPQEPQALFLKSTLRADLLDALADASLSQEEQKARMDWAVELCRLESLLERHPYDLSGGEKQRAALAKLLLTRPEILLLDEPTRGLDGGFKARLAEILSALSSQGVTIVMVSHDIEFCAQYAHRCALFFDGNVVTQGPPGEFFSGNNFYTTAANRMARDILPQAVTAQDIILACGGHISPQVPLSPPPPSTTSPVAEQPSERPKRRSWLRLAGAVLAAGVWIPLLLKLLGVIDLGFLSRLGLGRLARNQAALSLLFCAALFLFVLCLGRRAGRKLPPPARPPKRPASLWARLGTLCALLLLPVTLFVGVWYLPSKNYYIVALLVLLEAMTPFFLLFEGRRPQARELVLLAVLCAIGVAGRAAFFMLPQFKPVLAFTVIVGVAFGGETGFLVGAVTMLCSNMMFSQGPWTPWQMFAMGLVGLLAGLFARMGLLGRSRLGLCLFGALSALVVYGGIMNPASLLVWSREISWPLIASYYLTGLPMDCVHAAATWLFLWFTAQPLLEKLERVKAKYALVP